jgi:hypothetical protein
LKKVSGSRNPADAHLIKGILEAAGIEVIVQGEFLWGVRGEVPVGYDTSPTIWVKNDYDYDKANEIINEYQNVNNYTKAIDWKCMKCGESNEGLFTECWKCGTSKPY